jgi:CRISPR type III-A-associated RAMP protein Csm4
MPASHTDYQFRLKVCSPVAAGSPFDSDTLWGRILCALGEGSRDKQSLLENWLDELALLHAKPGRNWLPPLLISEGFQCGERHEPWLPIPLCVSLHLEQRHGALRKELKKVERIPLQKFVELCGGNPPSAEDLIGLKERSPEAKTSLQPHLAMDRFAGMGLEGQLYMTALRAFSPQEITFFLRLRDEQHATLIEATLRRVCEEGWGHAKSCGLGRVTFESLELWDPPWLATDKVNGFVSLSHFCPSTSDPTDGLWKLQVKHPTPAQFVNGKRVVLGEEEEQWRVKSFLRLRAGSCFRLAEPPGHYYGRMLTGLLDPAENGDGQPLPPLFHYALAFPVPIHWPSEGTAA